MSTQAIATGARAKTDVFGHPRGLWYLCFAEAWERFSYYGMLALLPLYLAKQLLHPGHVEHVAAFAPFRHLIDPSSTLTFVGLAAAISGLYGSIVYVTPIFGGLLADRFLGRTRAVIIGALLMSLGHFLMAFEVSFLAALTCLLIGVGFFKGNIAAQVGALYAPGDLRRGMAFQAYLLGIQIAVIASPVLCGWLAEGESFPQHAWHWGFGAAGVGMLIGLVVYLSGRKWLPPEQIIDTQGRAHRPQLAPGEWKPVVVLILLMPVLALASVGNQQIFTSYPLWADAHSDLNLFGWKIQTEFLSSLDSVVSMVTLILVVAFWRLWSRRFKEPDEIVKVAIGAFIGAGGPLMLALGSMHEAATGEKVSVSTYLLGFHILNDIGFAMVFPLGLALFSRVAPRAISGLMIGVYYLNLAMCTYFGGYSGRYLEKMSGADFWLMNAGIVASGGVLLALFAIFFHRILAPTSDPEQAAA
jgi:proton-dependent oligopeptide transporter, POT family